MEIEVLSAKEVCDIKKSLEVKSEQCVRFGMCTYFGFHLSVDMGSMNWSVKYELKCGRVKKKYVQVLQGVLFNNIE